MSEKTYATLPLRTAVGDHVGGGTPPRQVPSYWKGNIPWASVKDFPERAGVITDTQEHISVAGLNASASNLIPAGTPLVCTRMAVGRAAMASVGMAINQDVKALVPAAGVSPAYLLRLLQFIQARAEAQAVGSTVKGIRIQDYLDIAVPLADKGAQPVIARVLDTLDTAIHETEAIIAKLKAVKQGLLHDLLTRGIDANGELRPPQADAPHLYKESPLGWVPKEWDVLALGCCCVKIADRDHTTPTYVEDGVLMISPTNLLGDEEIDFAGAKRISRRAHETNRKKTDLAPGDIILHRIGAGLGRVRLVKAWMPEFSILHSMAQLRSNPRQMTSEFMLWAMRTETTKRQMGLGTQSIGVPDLGLDKISNFLVVKPPLLEQEEVARRLNVLQSRADAETSDLSKLSTLKSGLMDDLLTGRIRVTPLLAAEQQGGA